MTGECRAIHCHLKVTVSSVGISAKPDGKYSGVTPTFSPEETMDKDRPQLQGQSLSLRQALYSFQYNHPFCSVLVYIRDEWGEHIFFRQLYFKQLDYIRVWYTT